VHTTYFTF